MNVEEFQKIVKMEYVTPHDFIICFRYNYEPDAYRLVQISENITRYTSLKDMEYFANSLCTIAKEEEIIFSFDECVEYLKSLQNDLDR